MVFVMDQCETGSTLIQKEIKIPMEEKKDLTSDCIKNGLKSYIFK